MASQPSTIPSEIVCFEILTRTSPETLGRCRAVSKELNRTTYGSDFLKLFCERTNTTHGFFIQSLVKGKYIPSFVPMYTSVRAANGKYSNNNDNSSSECSKNILSLSFLRFPFMIEAAHRNLLVCVSRKNHKIPRYFMCNPTTQQWVNIPNPKTKYMTESTALVVLRSKPTLRYKIIRFSNPKSAVAPYENYLRCEVFDSDAWAWKQMKDVGLPYDVYFTPKKHVVLASGALHWLLTNNKVFAFHPDDETWEIFDLPPESDNTAWHKKHLKEFQGRLALIREETKDFMDLWVIKDYHIRTWSEREKLSIAALNETEPYSSYSFGDLCNTDAALMFGTSREVAFYNFRDSTFIKGAKLDGFADGIFMVQSDKQEIQLRRPILQNRITCCFDRISRYVIWRAISPNFSFILLLLFVVTLVCYLLDL